MTPVERQLRRWEAAGLMDRQAVARIQAFELPPSLDERLRRWQDAGRITRNELLGHVNSVRGLFPLLLPTPSVLDQALDLAGRYSLSHWDSMILGACKEAGVTTLYTEDMGAPMVYDGIQLIDPFV